MRRVLLSVLTALLCVVRVALAQSGPEHLRGTITNVTETTITVRTTENQTRTITINASTMIMRGNAHLTIKELKVGDRVVLDVDTKTSVATGVELGTSAPAAAPRATQSQPPPGQSSQPDAQQHEAMQMNMAPTGWQFMQDGVVFGVFNQQGGRRGDGHEFRVPNWWMGMLTRHVGTSQLTFNTMLSADPATVGKRGYSEIFQVGEVVDGKPLIDRQHPHDLFMQLAAVWRMAVTDKTGFTIAGGPAGEPALGPVAFMHRASSSENPFAPLSHHTFDSTHIAFGVVTAAVDHGPLTIEGSIFNGREPDENRWNFDFGRLDSVSGRVWWRPSDTWEFQASTGHLKHPEELEPGNIQRTTFSGGWFRRQDANFTAVTVGVGVNATDEANRNAVFGEATRHVGLNSLFARVESVQVETNLLLNDVVPLTPEGVARKDRVGAFTVGGVRDVVRSRGFEGGLGGSVAFYSVPDSLKATHGDHPVSFQIFFRLRPPAGSMGRMWNMRMSQPMSGHAMTMAMP